LLVFYTNETFLSARYFLTEMKRFSIKVEFEGEFMEGTPYRPVIMKLISLLQLQNIM